MYVPGPLLKLLPSFLLSNDHDHCHNNTITTVFMVFILVHIIVSIGVCDRWIVLFNWQGFIYLFRLFEETAWQVLAVLFVDYQKSGKMHDFTNLDSPDGLESVMTAFYLCD